jgi:hypothetical protein
MLARVTLCICVAAGLGLAGACGKKGGGGASPAGSAPQHVDGTPHPDEIVNAWKGAGLTTEGFALLAPPPYGAAYCEQGRVQAIEAVVCEYRDADALTRGKAALLAQWESEGGNTGVALASKLTLLGVLDRGRQDPNGKVISKVVETFRKL